MKRPTINLRYPAAPYAGPHERIAEIIGTHGGGLIRLTDTDDGLRIELYRLDRNVQVITSRGKP